MRLAVYGDEGLDPRTRGTRAPKRALAAAALAACLALARAEAPAGTSGSAQAAPGSALAARSPVASSAIAEGLLALEPREWKFGALDRGDAARARVSVSNESGAEIVVRFVPTCDCLAAEPDRLVLGPGAAAGIDLAYDSSDDEGKVAKAYLVQVEPAPGKPIYFLVSGLVRGSNLAGGGAWMRRSPGSKGLGGDRPTFSVAYYYVPGCKSCDEYLSETLPALEAELGVWIEVERKDLLDPAAYGELAGLAAARGEALRAMPALRAGEALLQGDAEIRERLPSIITEAALAGPSGSGSPTAPARPAAGGGPVPAAPPPALPAGGLGLLAVAAAGLVDGVNPCAFTTLVFLLASLALAGRGRREILAIGACYSLAVFATYTAIGLGLFAALRAASAAPAIGAALRWVLAAALAALSAASVYDYFLVRAGRAGEMLLQLPGFLKLRIHDAIRGRARARVRSLALAGSSLALGFLVSIFEFACSGQVYLPTLAYLARTGGGAWMLAAYNAFFIAPLLAVFAASYAGMGSARIAAAFKARLGAVKLALAAAFALLAALTAFVA